VPILPKLRALSLPILFFDTETTGLTDTDRVVSFGAVLLKSCDENPDERVDLSFATTHLIFNPDRKSAPRARAVHGHTDQELRRQQPLRERAAEILELFSAAHLIVGHNIEFDLGFLRREFSIAGLSMPVRATYCTMLKARACPRFSSARLSDLAIEIGVPRATIHHGALEDAWITMNIYFNLEINPPIRAMPFSVIQSPGFANYHEPTVRATHVRRKEARGQAFAPDEAVSLIPKGE
jgi:DNA polymerase-3 subunit epsilon